MSDESEQSNRAEELVKSAITVMILLLILSVYGLISWTSFTDGKKAGILESRNDAVLHHVAHYEPDAKGNPTFTWNNPIPSTPR